jgi:DNA modification methylase
MHSPDLVKIPEAARRVGKTEANIRYYIEYKRIGKYNAQGERINGKASNDTLRVSLTEIQQFLNLINRGIERHHSSDLDAELGFYQVPEYERTKHVHRLHPYLGKFIPQLVEWFLSRYFKEDDIILDPFMGSGTMLVQANEMRMHSIGVEISEFNCLIARVKLANYDLDKARREVLDAEKRLTEFSNASFIAADSRQLPLIPESQLESLKWGIKSDVQSDYLRTWFADRTLAEMLFYRSIIEDYDYQDLLRIILSRAVRSARLIPHYDLARPKSPIEPGKEYWCKKHRRYCKPIEELLVKVHNYSMDTTRRLETFSKLRSDKYFKIIQRDSRKVNLEEEFRFSPLENKRIDGIFTSPPYVGQIDYHDQHIYAYELFGFKRNDGAEIGSRKTGQSTKAQRDYIEGISASLRNVNQYLKDDAKVFIVANDKYNLYPEIAKRSGMEIIQKFKRAVTKRTEQGDNPYQETIFLMRKVKS